MKNRVFEITIIENYHLINLELISNNVIVYARHNEPTVTAVSFVAVGFVPDIYGTLCKLYPLCRTVYNSRKASLDEFFASNYRIILFALRFVQFF